MSCSLLCNLKAFFNLDLNLALCHKCDSLVTSGLQTGLLIPWPCLSPLWLWLLFLDHLLTFLPQGLNCVFLSCERLCSLHRSGASFFQHFSPGIFICSWPFLPSSDHELLSQPWNMESILGICTSLIAWQNILHNYYSSLMKLQPSSLLILSTN